MANMEDVTYFLSGTAKWARLNEPREAYDPSKPREYSVDLYLDDNSLDLFKASGSKKKLRESPEGEPYVSLTCPEERMNRGVMEPDKPTVYGPDNSLFTGEIGNGSNVTCKVVVYDTKRGIKGTRLAAVRVNELVEYVPNTQRMERVGNEIASPF